MRKFVLAFALLCISPALLSAASPTEAPEVDLEALEAAIFAAPEEGAEAAPEVSEETLGLDLFAEFGAQEQAASCEEARRDCRSLCRASGCFGVLVQCDNANPAAATCDCYDCGC